MIYQIGIALILALSLLNLALNLQKPECAQEEMLRYRNHRRWCL